MSAYALSPVARLQVDAIYDYTVERWGEDQADTYIFALFEELERIAARKVVWCRLPAAFEVDAFSRTWRSHVIYWTAVESSLRVAAVLHGHMDQISRVREALAVDVGEVDGPHAHPSST